jgi:hypothetical protein
VQHWQLLLIAPWEYTAIHTMHECIEILKSGDDAYPTSIDPPVHRPKLIVKLLAKHENSNVGWLFWHFSLEITWTTNEIKWNWKR